MSRFILVALVSLVFSAVAVQSAENEAWPEPASSILNQIQEAEREFLAAAATGSSNPCLPVSPCKNGGTCTAEAGGFFRCACPGNFIGRDCGFLGGSFGDNSVKQPRVMHVQGVRARGTASMETKAAAAENMTVHSAGSASTADDYCARFSPCLHGGMCQSVAGGYKCICKPGWVGHDCALALDANVWSSNSQ